MPAKVLERQRVKIVSLVNSKLTFPHHLSLQEAASLGPLGVNTGIVADFVKCRMIIQSLMMANFISAGLSLLKPHYSYFHWLENRIAQNEATSSGTFMHAARVI